MAESCGIPAIIWIITLSFAFFGVKTFIEIIMKTFKKTLAPINEDKEWRV